MKSKIHEFHSLKNGDMSKNQIIKATITTAIIFIANLALTAQPGGGGGGQGQGGPPPSSAVPIDGGAILLALGAAAYGRKKLKGDTAVVQD